MPINDNLKKNNQDRAKQLVFTMASIVLVLLIFVLIQLVWTAYSDNKARLLSEIALQKEIIEAVGRFDAANSQNDHVKGNVAATLSQVVDAFDRANKRSGTEYVLAEKRGDKVYFIVAFHKHDIIAQGKILSPYNLSDDEYFMPFTGEIGLPMKKALQGRTGTILARDYRNLTVLAAYTPVLIGNKQFGMVIKMDVREIWAPLLIAFILTILLAFLLIAFGVRRFLRLINPLIQRLEEENNANNAMFATSPSGIITIDRKGKIEKFNATAEHLFGYSANEVIGQNVNMLMPESIAQHHDQYIKRHLDTGEKRIIGIGREVEGQRKDGSAIPLHLAIGSFSKDSVRKFVGIVTDLSQIRQVMDDLKQKNRTIEESPVGVLITDTDGIINYINPALVDMYGFTDEELLGHKPTVLKSKKTPQSTFKDLWACLQSGKDWTGEMVNVRKDGVEVWVRQHIFSIRDLQGSLVHFVSIQEDVTELRQYRENLEQTVKEQTAALELAKDIAERKATEEKVHANLLKLALKATEVDDFLQQAFSSVIESISWVNHMHKGGIFLNDHLEENKNFRLVAAYDFPGLLKLGERVDFSEYLADLAFHKGLVQFSNKIDKHFTNRLGSMASHRYFSIPIIHNELIFGMLIIFPTQGYICSQKDEDFLRQVVNVLSIGISRRYDRQDLLHAKEVAETAAKTKSAFLANMSHEIRTPMNSVIGFAEVVLRDGGLAPHNVEHLKTILYSSKSLLGILNDILDFSKLESGKLSLENRCIHLPGALMEAIKTLDHQVKEKDIQLKFSYDNELPFYFIGDQLRLRQVILNLVGNAVKFTESGSVTLHVGPKGPDGMIEISVIDTGIGMTSDQLERIFDSFSQADASTTRRFGGTGLGTSISRQIVTLMGGELWAESTPGQGSTFHISLPLEEAEDTSDCVQADNGFLTDEFISPRLFNVLVAEDIKVNADLVKLRLEEMGHRVTWVENGREAVDALEQTDYDLLLMDIQMPELDGLSAARLIRQREQKTGKRLTILALTASITREEHQKSIDAGMDGVEGKPIDFNQLFHSMEKMVPIGRGQINHNISIEVKEKDEFNLALLEGTIDYEKALKIWHDAPVLTKALKTFADDRSHDVSEIKRLIQEHPDDLEMARSIIHKLKGLAGNLSLTQVAAITSTIDGKMKSGNIEKLDKDLSLLDQYLRQANNAISKLSLNNTEPMILKDEYNAENVQLLLQELLNVFGELNPDFAIPILDKLAAYLDQSDLKPIQDEIDNFDFEAAAAKAINLGKVLNLTLE